MEAAGILLSVGARHAVPGTAPIRSVIGDRDENGADVERLMRCDYARARFGSAFSIASANSPLTKRG